MANEFFRVNTKFCIVRINEAGEKRMKQKSNALFIACSIVMQMIIAISMLQAQDGDKKSVIIQSTPPGAMLYFEGENSFVGVAPLKLRAKMIGNYKILAVKSGFEKQKLEYFFRGTESGVMKIKLAPKTPFKAGLRSFVFPGWGQIYSERKTSGLLMSLAALGAGIGTMKTHLDYNKALNDYDKAYDDYQENKTNYQLADEYKKIVEEKYARADDVFQRRQTWLIITGSLWIYNFLDSIFFFPSFENAVFNRATPSFSASFQNEAIALSVTIPF